MCEDKTIKFSCDPVSAGFEERRYKCLNNDAVFGMSIWLCKATTEESIHLNNESK